MLLLDNVSFSFPKRPVLADFTLHCNAGETIGFVGKSGVGKTTLLNLISGYLVGFSGRILIGGEEPREAARKQKIGFIFQSPALIPWLTVKQNVSLPLELHDKRNGGLENHVEAAMQSARIHHAESLLPHQLSGGMQTRAAIARMIAYHPNVRLMDEPFAGLDDVIKEEIFMELQMHWFESEAANVLVSHDLSEVTRLCDRVYVLKASEGGVCRIVHCEQISLKKPRGIEVLEDTQFLNARMRIWQQLQ